MEESKKSGKLRALLALALAPLATAQDDEAFTLSPFTVEATQGYTATSTISGTGLNTEVDPENWTGGLVG